MTMNFSKRTGAHVAVWCASLVLSGCFSSDDEQTPVPVAPVMIDVLKTVPAAASETIAGLLAFQRDVLARPQADQDKAEPIDLTGISIPSSETAEPVEV